MRPKLIGNIVFVFSDPGGAKPCLSLIELNNLSNATAISDRQHTFYSCFKTNVIILKDNYEQFIESINPDLIYTGTSYTSDIEKQFIKIAHFRNIPCYSFVDHWTSISQRFKDISGKMILPDKVWVIDEHARQIAIKEGIDRDKIVISGNPYHKWLKKWKASESKVEFFNNIKLKQPYKRILLYAPDPLSNVNGIDIYGFDELSATLALIKIFDAHKTELKDWIVLVKAHPNQDMCKLKDYISGHDFFFMLPENVDTNLAIYYSDVVMGFFSSLLIEASIMNKQVLRFLVGKVENDPLAELKIGNVVYPFTFIQVFKKSIF